MKRCSICGRRLANGAANGQCPGDRLTAQSSGLAPRSVIRVPAPRRFKSANPRGEAGSPGGTRDQPNTKEPSHG
jgi:hypothetical protein